MLMNFKLFHMALIALLIQASPVWAVEAGKPLPDLGLAEVQKTKGQYIYIDYWASWCGPCRQSFPWMNALQAKLGPKGLKVVAVNVDAKRADADRFLSHTPAQFTIAYDPQGESAKKLAIKPCPLRCWSVQRGECCLCILDLGLRRRCSLRQRFQRPWVIDL